MPRYAIKPVRTWTVLYTEADDTLDAVNWARRVLIDAARHGELDIVRLREHPEPYDQERDDQLDFLPADDPHDLERPFAGDWNGP